MKLNVNLFHKCYFEQNFATMLCFHLVLAFYSEKKMSQRIYVLARLKTKILVFIILFNFSSFRCFLLLSVLLMLVQFVYFFEHVVITISEAEFLVLFTVTQCVKLFKILAFFASALNILFNDVDFISCGAFLSA